MCMPPKGGTTRMEVRGMRCASFMTHSQYECCETIHPRCLHSELSHMAAHQPCNESGVLSLRHCNPRSRVHTHHSSALNPAIVTL